ncbi:unnamed protein product [Prorocentrum cordatum]|uniref:Uncharacterized protein n=1 Tax=Prorocentrum cordatum TaxID=2364126 RepID=A0ABN9QPE6_9DINO|nr:unnamed protein product [Polarella glacialis]
MHAALSSSRHCRLNFSSTTRCSVGRCSCFGVCLSVFMERLRQSQFLRPSFLFNCTQCAPDVWVDNVSTSRDVDDTSVFGLRGIVDVDFVLSVFEQRHPVY